MNQWDMDTKHSIMQRIPIRFQVELENFTKVGRERLAKFYPIYKLSRIRVFLVSSSIAFVKYDKWCNLSRWIMSTMEFKRTEQNEHLTHKCAHKCAASVFDN